jgi:hypothetical protein
MMESYSGRLHLMSEQSFAPLSAAIALRNGMEKCCEIRARK